MTLNDSGHNEWFMYTGASSHLHSNAGILEIVFDNSNNSSSSVLVGDGSSIPVTKMGHSTLPHPNPYRTLILKNVLITPSITKNLIFVRPFVRENKCAIKFDAFGFSVKDFRTHQILLRCDNVDDLYHVKSPTPQAFITISSVYLASTSRSTWSSCFPTIIHHINERYGEGNYHRL